MVARIRKRICWIAWKDVCRPKKERGIGSRHFKAFNMDLIGKLIWRCLVGHKAF